MALCPRSARIRGAHGSHPTHEHHQECDNGDGGGGNRCCCGCRWCDGSITPAIRSAFAAASASTRLCISPTGVVGINCNSCGTRHCVFIFFFFVVVVVGGGCNSNGRRKRECLANGRQIFFHPPERPQ